MRPTLVSRLAAQLAERRSGWRADWIWVAFVLAVLLLIAVGVLMTVALSAQAAPAGTAGYLATSVGGRATPAGS